MKTFRRKRNCGARSNPGSRHMSLYHVYMLSPTNYRGARVKVVSLRFKKSITQDYDYGLGDIRKQAQKILMRRGIPVTAFGMGQKGYILASPVFKSI